MEENIKRRILAEPRHERTLYRILGDCLDPIAFRDLEARICAYPETRTRTHDPATLVSWLVDAGAIDAREIVRAAEAATGDLLDAAAENGACGKETVLTVTEPGRRVWAEHEESDGLGRLMEEAGPFKHAYHRVLELCRVPQTKGALERALVAEGLLNTKERQVSCFLDKLEKTGGLVWDGGWMTTRCGLAYLA